MKRNNTSNEQHIKELIFEYEAMSHKGTVGFYEKTAFIQLIDHYLNQELFDEALEVIEHAVSQHPFSGTFHIVQAQLFIEKNCENLALEALDKAIIYAPSTFEVQILRAEALSSMQAHQEAFEILEDLLPNASSEQKSEIYLSKALIFESTKRYNEMFTNLKKAVIVNPKNKDAFERIWFSVEMTQQYDSSIKFHQEIIDIDPYSYIAWYNLGFAFAAKDDHKNARDAFEYAFIINDQFEFAYRECAESCIKLKDYEKALKCYEELQEHFDVDADLLMKIGLCYEGQGTPEKAKSYYLRAQELDEDNDEIYYHLANCLSKDGDLDGALEVLKKALMIDSLKEEYYLALAKVYYRKKDITNAQEYYQKATEIAPDMSKCWIHFANFLLKTGKNQKALNLLDEAELYAFGTELLYCRIAILFSLKRRKEACSLLQKALEENYKKHRLLFKLVPSLKDDKDIKHIISTFSI